MGLRSLSRREFVINAAATALLMPVYHRREWRSREATRVWQLERITRLVQRAYEQVSLYRDVYDTAGIQPRDVRTWDDVASLPTIAKSDLIDGFPARLSWQLVQEPDLLRVRIVSPPADADDSDGLGGRLTDALARSGAVVPPITIEPVAEIERGANGKVAPIQIRDPGSRGCPHGRRPLGTRGAPE